MCIQKATEFELLPILFCYPWLGRSCEYFEMPKYDLLVKIQNLCNNWLHLLSPSCFFAISWVLLVVPILSGWGWVMENLNLHSSAALREFRSFRCHFWTIHLQCCCCHSQGSLFFVIKGETSLAKTPFLRWFYKKLGPFYKKLNFDNLSRPKSQNVRKC